MKCLQELIACSNRSLDTISPASQKCISALFLFPFILNLNGPAQTSHLHMNGSSMFYACINLIFLTIVELFVWIMTRLARERLTELHVDFIGLEQHHRRIIDVGHQSPISESLNSASSALNSAQSQLRLGHKEL